MSDDAPLLRRYAEEGSEAAFAELVRRHVDHVYSTALRLVGGDTHRAEDVAQAVFVSLARKASVLKHHPVLAGWLYTATHHAAAQVVRGEARRRRREEEAHAMNDILKDDSAGASSDWTHVRPVLDAALRDLGERDREAVVLRFFAQRPFAEIGRALRVSEDAARMRVERAVEKLRAQLVRRGVTSSAGALMVALETQAVGAAPTGLAASLAQAACAAASGSVGTIGFVAQLMAETKVMIGVAGALACVMGVVVLNQHLERRSAEAAWHEAMRGVETRTTEMQALARRVAEAERSANELGRSLERRRAEIAAAVKPEATANGAAPTTNTAQLTPVQAGNAFLKRHPDVKAALDTWANAGADGIWHAFYQARGLTAAQIDEFRYLVRSRSFIPGEGPDGQVLQLFTGAYHSQTEIDRRLQTLLGDEAFADFRQRVEQKWGRQAAGEVAGALCFSDTPLSVAQHARLAETMTRHRAPPAEGSRSSVNFEWAAVVNEAAGFLGSQQLTALEAVRAHAAFQERWNQAPNPVDIAAASAAAAK